MKLCAGAAGNAAARAGAPPGPHLTHDDTPPGEQRARRLYIGENSPFSYVECSAGRLETAPSARSSAQRSSTTMSLPSCPGAGNELIEGHRCASTAGFVEPFNFAAVGGPTTNFTRPRTRSSNPVPSSGESAAKLDLGEGSLADEIAAAPPGGFTCWRTRPLSP